MKRDCYGTEALACAAGEALSHARIAAVRSTAQAAVTVAASPPKLAILSGCLSDHEDWPQLAGLIRSCTPVPVIVAVNARSARVLATLLELGADGVVDPFDISHADLTAAIATVADGGKYLGARHAALLREERFHESEMKYLTPADLRALPVLGLDRTDDESAALLGLSECSIPRLRHSLIRKLGAGDRRGLIHRALTAGYVAVLPSGEFVPGLTAVLRGFAAGSGKREAGSGKREAGSGKREAGSGVA